MRTKPGYCECCEAYHRKPERSCRCRCSSKVLTAAGWRPLPPDKQALAIRKRYQQQEADS